MTRDVFVLERVNLVKKSKEEDNRFSEITNVEKMHDMLIPEEFPEGPLGSAFHKAAPVQGKSTEWETGQQRTSGYVYADKEQHDDLERQTPGAHPLHDE